MGEYRLGQDRQDRQDQRSFGKYLQIRSYETFLQRKIEDKMADLGSRRIAHTIPWTIHYVLHPASIAGPFRIWTKIAPCLQFDNLPKKCLSTSHL